MRTGDSWAPPPSPAPPASMPGYFRAEQNLNPVTPRMITDLFGSVSIARETNRKRKKINKQKASAAGHTWQKYLKRETGSLLPRALYALQGNYRENVR